MIHGALSDLVPGEGCVIDRIDIDGPVRRRMLDLGMHPGSKVRCAYIAPSGTPMAFWVKDCMLAMRKSDCRQVGIIPDA